MTTHQFFIRQSQIDSERKVKLEGPDARHIRLVLRLRNGSKIRLADEKQNIHLASVEQITRGAVIARVIETFENVRPKTRLTIVQGIPKPPKTDLIIQKLTELGADSVVFAPTEFTSYPGAYEKVSRRLDRLRKIAEAAAKQCMRRDIPDIAVHLSLEEALKTVPAGALLLVGNEKAARENLRGMLQQKRPHDAVVAFIGPEGGFSDEEIHLLERKGAFSFSLGRNILRTETAAIAAAAIILYELGEV
jgi:16S rRNA (uracil1498-N3)-methyltransferase